MHVDYIGYNTWKVITMKKDFLFGKLHRIWSVLGIIIVLGLFVLCTDMVSAKEGTKRVLFISSYSYGWDTVKAQLDGMDEVLPKDYIIDYEFMDTYRVNDTNSLRLFYENTKYHMDRTTSYDVILVGDDAALKFAYRYQSDLFQDTPIVFMGVNDEDFAKKAAEDPMITGVVQKLDYKSTIEVAVKAIPKADTVIAIVDNSQTGQIEKKNYYKAKQYFPDLKFQEINMSDVMPADVAKRINEVPYNTILLYIGLTTDKGDTLYLPDDARRIVVSNAKVPVFVLMDSDTGCGTLGGATFSMKQNSIDASNMVVDIIEGRKSVKNIPIMSRESQNFKVDAQIMDNYSINKKIFPKSTEYINGKQSFFQKYGDVIKPVIISVLISLAVLCIVLYDNYKHRKMTKEMKEMKDHLENASQHDFLTGLGNRSKFMADLKVLMQDDSACTVIMLDLDNFKGINDNLGHAMGDEALKGVAGRLKEMATPLFTPYRFAGDEFIMILKSDNEKIVENVVRQCWQVFQKPYHLLNTTMDIHGSIGVATSPQDTTDMEQLIVCADDAMYEIKKEGKNGIAYYRDVKARMIEEMQRKQMEQQLLEEQQKEQQAQADTQPRLLAPGSFLGSQQ